MCKNMKRLDEIESKTELIDLSTYTGAPNTGPYARQGRQTRPMVRKDEPRIQVKTEGFSSGILTASFGTESEESEKEISRHSEGEFKILVVDDNENIREMLEDFLNLEGHTPVLAKDGEEALKAFSEQDFDIVITDLGMPGMSGWEVNKRIKEKKPEIPVVIITGWGAQLGAEVLKENKVEWILSKPFNLGQFKHLLETVGAKFLRKDG